MEETRKKIEYLLKNMDIDASREVIYLLERQFPKFYEPYVEAFGDDYDNGYDRLANSFSIFSNAESSKIFVKNRRDVFEQINAVMEKNNRQPIFAEPQNITESWHTRNDVLEPRPESELEKYFGATLADFNPEEYFKTHAEVFKKKLIDEPSMEPKSDN